MTDEAQGQADEHDEHEDLEFASPGDFEVYDDVDPDTIVDAGAPQ